MIYLSIPTCRSSIRDRLFCTITLVMQLLNESEHSHAFLYTYLNDSGLTNKFRNVQAFLLVAFAVQKRILKPSASDLVILRKMQMHSRDLSRMKHDGLALHAFTTYKAYAGFALLCQRQSFFQHAQPMCIFCCLGSAYAAHFRLFLAWSWGLILPIHLSSQGPNIPKMVLDYAAGSP